MTLPGLVRRYLAWLQHGARPADAREIEAAQAAAAAPTPEEVTLAARASDRALRRAAARPDPARDADPPA